MAAPRSAGGPGAVSEAGTRWQEAIDGGPLNLTMVKRGYDPANLFRVNHNIPPVR